MSLARRTLVSRSPTTAQQFVADDVTERVVDHLETVEIEKQQQAALVVAQRDFDRVGQAVVEQQPIGQGPSAGRDGRDG